MIGIINYDSGHVNNLAAAVKKGNKTEHVDYMTRLRDDFIKRLEENIEGIILNGPRGEDRLCNNINLSFPVDGEMLGEKLNAKDIYVSKGSACSNLKGKRSHVLKALGSTNERCDNSLRITISRFTTEDELNKAADEIISIVKGMQKGGLTEKIFGK